jgi:RNA polymerase sigma factor (sigma-70 family)
MSSRSVLSARSRRAYVAVMVLGTAFSALGQSALQAQDVPETTLRAVTDMSRYCTTCWRNARLQADCWNDCTQEVFSRLLERVPTTGWEHVLKDEGDERREFLRAIDTVKKRVQRRRSTTDLPLEMLADEREARERRLTQERQEVRRAAAELLTERQQKIMQLSLDSWSVQEIADELSLPAERVSDEKYKAIRKLRSHLGTEA